MGTIAPTKVQIYTYYPQNFWKFEYEKVAYTRFMDSALKEELFESVLLDVPGLVEHLFPDSLFPIPFSSLENAVLETHWDSRQKVWKVYGAVKPSIFVTSAKPGVAETDLATFFNTISETLIEVSNSTEKSFKLSIDRRWVSNSSKSMLWGHQVKRKPDICLANKDKAATWHSTLVTTELKLKASDANDAFNQLANSACTIFSTQDDRRFHIGLSICDTSVRVYVFDRAGVIGSSHFHLSEDASLLIRLIAGLTLTDVGALGFDPSIKRNDDGSRTVSVAGVDYRILKTLFISDSIRGRGTVCWKASSGGSEYVIKNSWTDVSRLKTEADIMRMADGIEGIAQLIAEEIVHDNSLDNTNVKDYKRMDWYDKLEVRVHRRLVTTPVAQPVEYFKSKKELLSVIIDGIEAHARLLEKHILHRDISMANIMIHRPSQGSSNDTNTSSAEVQKPSTSVVASKRSVVSAKGILIDLDYALITNDESGKETQREADATGHRTGTLPFMAIDILMNATEGEHQAHHDIESFFYVLLWIMLQYAGPSGIERQDLDIKSVDTFKGWIHGRDIALIGATKWAIMSTVLPQIFEATVTKFVTLYFKDLVPCIEELRQLIFVRRNQGFNPTHEAVIAILRKHMLMLPDDDKWSRENDPAGYGPVGGKRKLETFQEEEEEAEEDPLEASPSAGRNKRAKTAPSRLIPTRRSVRI
ncbi:hypothetical protein JR316_0011051 [Psilocybe cubensis]|uniref:Uncharacterized protein n=1 Tax=Psilocybe cubensis TaxID=181762 RepID=A0ACB8GNT4_PSICU|nr:hypothetical protein JR316_0011051 [Psilocybe cubensis]KAH9477135.1 hypothetical protein JR316_0011051 [Psilocybe cubensis]